MKVTEQPASGLKKAFTVQLPAADLNRHMETRLKALGSRTKIAGFRPGHVPMNVLQQRYGKSVLGEVLDDSIRLASQQVIQQHKIRPATQPKIEITKFEEGSDLEFSMDVEVFPEVPEMNFSDIAIEKPTFDVSEEEINEAISRFAARNKSMVRRDKGAKAQKGDVVVIDFKGSVDGEYFPGGEAKNFRLELGSSQFISGFEDQIVGAKEGDELTVNVTFPEGYHKEDLSGKPAKFEVTVHEVHEARVPEATDEFAKSVGFESLDKLKDAVRGQIASEYQGAARAKMKKQLFDILEEKATFDVPPGMLEMEFESIWQRLQEAKKQGDPSLDKPEDELRKEYRKIAERRVRLGILLADVGTRQNLQVSNEELTRAVMEQARMFPGEEKKVFEFYRSHPSRLDELRGPILEDKAVDYILEQVKQTERPMSAAELMGEDEAKPAAGAKKKKSK